MEEHSIPSKEEIDERFLLERKRSNLVVKYTNGKFYKRKETTIKRNYLQTAKALEEKQHLQHQRNELARNIINEIGKLQATEGSSSVRVEKRSIGIQSSFQSASEMQAMQTTLSGVDFTIDKLSSDHKFTCTSPRFADDEEIKCQPRMRTIGLQKNDPNEQTPTVTIVVDEPKPTQICKVDGDGAAGDGCAKLKSQFPFLGFSCFDYDAIKPKPIQVYHHQYQHPSMAAGCYTCHMQNPNHHYQHNNSGMHNRNLCSGQMNCSPQRDYQYCCNQYAYECPPPRSSYFSSMEQPTTGQCPRSPALSTYYQCRQFRGSQPPPPPLQRLSKQYDRSCSSSKPKESSRNNGDLIRSPRQPKLQKDVKMVEKYMRSLAPNYRKCQKTESRRDVCGRSSTRCSLTPSEFFEANCDLFKPSKQCKAETSKECDKAESRRNECARPSTRCKLTPSEFFEANCDLYKPSKQCKLEKDEKMMAKYMRTIGQNSRKCYQSESPRKTTVTPPTPRGKKPMKAERCSRRSSGDVRRRYKHAENLAEILLIDKEFAKDSSYTDVGATIPSSDEPTTTKSSFKGDIKVKSEPMYDDNGSSGADNSASSCTLKEEMPWKSETDSDLSQVKSEPNYSLEDITYNYDGKFENYEEPLYAMPTRDIKKEHQQYQKYDEQQQGTSKQMQQRQFKTETNDDKSKRNEGEQQQKYWPCDNKSDKWQCPLVKEEPKPCAKSEPYMQRPFVKEESKTCCRNVPKSPLIKTESNQCVRNERKRQAPLIKIEGKECVKNEPNMQGPLIKMEGKQCVKSERSMQRPFVKEEPKQCFQNVPNMQRPLVKEEPKQCFQSVPKMQRPFVKEEPKQCFQNVPKMQRPFVKEETKPCFQSVPNMQSPYVKMEGKQCVKMENSHPQVQYKDPRGNQELRHKVKGESYQPNYAEQLQQQQKQRHRLQVLQTQLMEVQQSESQPCFETNDFRLKQKLQMNDDAATCAAMQQNRPCVMMADAKPAQQEQPDCRRQQLQDSCQRQEKCSPPNVANVQSCPNECRVKAEKVDDNTSGRQQRGGTPRGQAIQKECMTSAKNANAKASLSNMLVTVARKVSSESWKSSRSGVQKCKGNCYYTMPSFSGCPCMMETYLRIFSICSGNAVTQ